MVYTSNRDGGGSVPSGHLAHPPPEGRLRRTGIFICRRNVGNNLTDNPQLPEMAAVFFNKVLAIYRLPRFRQLLRP